MFACRNTKFEFMTIQIKNKINIAQYEKTSFIKGQIYWPYMT